MENNLTKASGNEEYVRVLFQEFLKDDRAVLDFYKLWLLGNFRIDEHYNAIAADIGTRDENDIIKSVLKNASSEVEAYFLGILEARDDSRLEELEGFYQQFELLEFNKATFMEIK